MTQEASQEALNNESGAPTDQETLNESGVTSTPLETEDGMISTTEFKVVEAPKPEEEEGGKPSDEEGNEDGKADEGGEPEEKGPVTYERFKEKVDQFNDLKKQFDELQGQFKNIQDNPPKAKPDESGKTPTQEQKKYVDISTMDDDKIADWMDEKPLQFFGNLFQQIVAEAETVIMGKLENMGRQNAYQRTFSEFSEKHEGFKAMHDSGQLQRFIDDNPGFDVFSAYHELTSETNAKTAEEARQQEIDSAVQKAVKEVEDKYKKNKQAMRELRPTDGGATPPAATADKELQDTKSGGGLVSVLANRLASRRKQAAG